MRTPWRVLYQRRWVRIALDIIAFAILLLTIASLAYGCALLPKNSPQTQGATRQELSQDIRALSAQLTSVVASYSKQVQNDLWPIVLLLCVLGLGGFAAVVLVLWVQKRTSYLVQKPKYEQCKPKP